MEEIIENKIIKKEDVEEQILFVSVNDYIESESGEDISMDCYDTLDKEEKHSFCEQFHIQSTNVKSENENFLVKNKDCDLDKCKEDVNLNSEVYKSKFNMGTSFRSNRYRYNIQGDIGTKSSQEKSECNYSSIKTGEIIINIRDKPYKCNECNYSSKRSNDIRKHIMRKHTQEKPYKCGECDYSFIQSGDLGRHMRIHTGEKPYKCNLCNYSSPRSDDLRSHIMRKHPAEKTYKCSVCDYSCIQLGDLGRHMRTHTGKKPYKCNVCNYSSTWSGDLRKHIMRKHTGEKPYKCSKCGYYCIRSSDLGNHMRIHIEGKT